MKKFIYAVALALVAAITGCQNPSGTSSTEASQSPAAPPANNSNQKDFKVVWSHYTGWEPWGYAEKSGILKKWADKYGITIELVRMDDYVASINDYTAGKFDACAMTNMDALTIPALSNVDSEAVIIGDYSNGNDGIVLKNGNRVTDLKGRELMLVKGSVSQYVMARAFASEGVFEKDVKLVDISDAKIADAYLANPNGAAVTWNPHLARIRSAAGSNQVFHSGMIPREILDLMVVKTAAPDSFKKALTGAWYETLAVMRSEGDKSKEAIEFMAKNSDSTVDEFNDQLKTTAMFYTPYEALQFSLSPELKNTMNEVRNFSFKSGLYPQSASSADVVGIAFEDGTVLGDSKNIKLRFTAKYVQMAQDKAL
jgi:NitT/TauT family transport system substrate-binding protein